MPPHRRRPGAGTAAGAAGMYGPQGPRFDFTNHAESAEYSEATDWAVSEVWMTMRIGLVLRHFDPRRGGAEHWTVQFAAQLLARGHQVHVVAAHFGQHVRTMPIVAHPLQRARSRIGFAEAAEAKLRSLPLDVVHDMGCGWYCDVFESHDGARPAQWEQKLLLLPPWVRPLKRMLIRVLPRYRNFRKLSMRQFADPQRIVLALSRMVAADYQRCHGVRPEQIRLVYNGVDTRRFSPAHRRLYRDEVRRRLDLREDDVLFLFVGHDFQRKGLATALRAIGRLVAEGAPARLVIVGGKRIKRYAQLARRCGAVTSGGPPGRPAGGQAVTFLGTTDDPVPYYAASDAYVLPTFYDPCSLGVLEAAASGLPSVTTRFNGAAELLTDGVDGYVLGDPADDKAFADRLRALLDRSLRRRMGEAARRLALEHTFDRNCEEILAVYREVSGVRRRAA